MSTSSNVPNWVVAASELLSYDSTQRRKFLVDKLIPSGVIALLTGPSDTGKSMFCRQLAVDVVLGKTEFIGLPLNVEHHRSLYITTEDGRADWSEKLHQYELTPQDNILIGKNLSVVFEYENITEVSLENILSQNPTDVAFIDVFSDTFGKDINNSIHVREYFKPYKRLSEQTGTTFIFIHHLNKRGEAGTPNKLNVLGSQALESAVRLVMEIRNYPNDVEKKNLTITKCNYLSAADKARVRTLRMLPTLRFENTGDIFTTIGQRSPTAIIHQPNIKDQIIKLSKEGDSIRLIADKLSSEGIPISKTTVGHILKNDQVDKNGSDISIREEEPVG